MPGGFLPYTDGGLLHFGRNFTQLTTAAPGDYLLPVELVASCAAAYVAYAQAYTRATQPDTRTSGSVKVKNECRDALARQLRVLGALVKAQPLVSTELKHGLGLTLPGERRRVVPPPDEAPYVRIVSVLGRTITLRLEPVASGSGRRPHGAAGALVWVHRGERPPAFDPSKWHMAANLSRRVAKLAFPPSATGDVVWVSAYWYSNTKVPGPVSQPMCVNLPAGGTMPDESGALRVAA